MGRKARDLRPIDQLPGQDSNLDKESQKTFQDEHKVLPDNASGDGLDRFARGFARKESNPPPSGPATPVTDPDLARILDAWPTLPAPIRRAVLALIESGQ